MKHEGVQLITSMQDQGLISSLVLPGTNDLGVESNPIVLIFLATEVL